MKLTKQDADLFFEIMWALQFFVNQRLNILPGIKTVEQYKELSSQDKLEVRNALFENLDLIEAFVKENPQQLSADKLEIAAKWQNCVVGNFYIERMLKKYTIFISLDDKVYAVLGLYDALQDIIHKSRLPLYVWAVLLPFKGMIIYDGLFQSSNIFFGGNITAELKEVYMTAKHNGEIIESLEPGATPAKQPSTETVTKEWTPVLEEMLTLAKQLRGGGGQPRLNSPAFSLVRASLDLAHSAVSNPQDVDELFKQLNKVGQAARKVENTLYRM